MADVLSGLAPQRSRLSLASIRRLGMVSIEMTSFPDLSRVLIVLGCALTVIGLLHNVPPVSRWDSRTSRFLHLELHRFLPLFRTLWLFGKSPLLMVVLLLILCCARQSAGWAALFYLLIAAGERAMKLRIKRPRPFAQVPEVEMRQPRQPYDPSFPSGDAMRLWYLAFILPAAFPLPGLFFFLFAAIAFLASLGRIAFGVHFFLDVVGGSGLGLLGAGLFLRCF